MAGRRRGAGRGAGCAGRADEIEAIAVTALRERFGDLSGHADLDTLAGRVVAGDTDPYRAADTLLDTV